MPSLNPGKVRPTAITVLGILNIIFGSMGLLLYLCCGGIGLVIVFGNTVETLADKIPELKIITVMRDEVFREIPGVKAYFVSLIASKTLLSFGLLVGGIGLLKMRKWARVFCILVALTAIGVKGADTMYQIVVYMPGMERVQPKIMAKLNAPAPPQNPMLNPAGSLISSIVGVAYDVVLLVFLLNPGIARAFREEQGLVENAEPSSEYPADEDDDLR